MNDSRRKRLAKAGEQVAQALILLTEVQEEENESFDNLSENAQEGEKGEAMQLVISTLEDAENDLQEALNRIDDAQA